MNTQLISAMLAASVALGPSDTSAQEVTCGVNPKENIRNGCIVENTDYYAVLQKGVCSVRDALNPSTRKRTPVRALDVTYQTFLKYKEGNNMGMTHIGYVPFTINGDPQSSCASLVRYAAKQVFQQMKTPN